MDLLSSICFLKKEIDAVAVNLYFEKQIKLAYYSLIIIWFFKWACLRSKLAN